MAWNGYPPNQSENGWWWLQQADAPPCPAFWNAADGKWEQGGFFCGGSGTPSYLTSSTFTGGVRRGAVPGTVHLTPICEAAMHTEYSAPLIEGFKWAKEGMPKTSNPWTSAGARAAFDRGHDLAARFPRWVDAKEHLYAEALASAASSR